MSIPFRRATRRQAGRIPSAFCYSLKFASFLETVVKLRTALPVLLATLALCGCLGNTGSPQSPPTSVRAYGGDAMISVTWSGSAATSYWLFYAQDPTLSTNNWVNGLLNAGIALNPSSPWLLCNQVNNPNPTTQFPAMYFTMDGRTGTAPGGTGSAVVSSVARPAGGPYPGSGAPWTPGGGIGVTSGSLYGLGYVPVTTCGSTGAGGFPPAGLFVAVGSGGMIYTALLQPDVAGPLTADQGNMPLSWTPANLPPGFQSDLYAAAGNSSGANTATPGYSVVAVGAGGAILQSSDGINWTQVPSGTTANLRGVSVYSVDTATPVFVVVGDQGTILTSTDGIHWGAQISGTTNNLRAVQCDTPSNTCVAVGDGGTILMSIASPFSQWGRVPETASKTNNWIAVAYGNDDANSDAITLQLGAGTPTNAAALSSFYGGFSPLGYTYSSNPTQVGINTTNETIQTWVAVDAQGNTAYLSNAGTNQAWAFGSIPVTGGASIVGIGYTTRFLALDSGGNAYANETGVGTNWTSTGYAGVANPVALQSSGDGFVALNGSGSNVASY